MAVAKHGDGAASELVVLAEPPVLPLVASMPPTPLEILRLLMARPRTGLAILKFAITGLGPATAAVKRGDPVAERSESRRIHGMPSMVTK
jgi:hypothetical protein